MIIKITEWLGMQLLAIAFTRALIFITNSDSDDIWQRTESAEQKTMARLMHFSKEEEA